MATRQNLIDTYNANPTLQSRYTLPQYLALFDFSQTTTIPTTPTTPTQTPATPGIPNIINQNLFQGGGDGDGAPPSGPTYSRDDDLGTSDYQGPGPSFFESIIGIPSVAFNAFKNLPTPFNLARKVSEFTKQRAAEKAAAEAAAADATRQETRAIQARINRDPRGYDGSRGPSASPYGGGGGCLHSDYKADGGRVYLYNRLK